ncbi:hypothetical protein TNCV_2339611 [Trichonephila clavipes]|nr:hypothetical protein TNCV_2339611 [Trichonephila clavipes]
MRWWKVGKVHPVYTWGGGGGELSSGKRGGAEGRILSTSSPSKSKIEQIRHANCVGVGGLPSTWTCGQDDDVRDVYVFCDQKGKSDVGL